MHKGKFYARNLILKNLIIYRCIFVHLARVCTCLSLQNEQRKIIFANKILFCLLCLVSNRKKKLWIFPRALVEIRFCVKWILLHFTLKWCLLAFHFLYWSYCKCVEMQSLESKIMFILVLFVSCIQFKIIEIYTMFINYKQWVLCDAWCDNLKSRFLYKQKTVFNYIWSV